MAGKKNNLKNTEATQFKSGSEAVNAGRKGGIASGKARREKADLKKQLQLWLETDVARDKNGNPLTGAELMVQVAAKHMKDGNPKYWELIRDTAGFKPIDKIQVAEVDPEVIDEVDKIVNDIEAEEKPKRSSAKKTPKKRRTKNEAENN